MVLRVKNNDKDLFNYMKICDENNYLVMLPFVEVMEARRLDGLYIYIYSVICVFKETTELVQRRNREMMSNGMAMVRQL